MFFSNGADPSSHDHREISSVRRGNPCLDLMGDNDSSCSANFFNHPRGPLANPRVVKHARLARECLGHELSISETPRPLSSENVKRLGP